MIHPHTSTRQISSQVGLGVFATQFIPRGTIVWARDELDQTFAPRAVTQMSGPVRAVIERYGYRAPSGDWVLCWDAGRLVNHACDPTLRGIDPEIMVARRDLQPGDEITCDYAECNLTEPLRCGCGHADCRQLIGGDDILVQGPTWESEAQRLLQLCAAVEQPLLPYLLDRQRYVELIDGQRQREPFTAHHAAMSADGGPVEFGFVYTPV